MSTELGARTWGPWRAVGGFLAVVVPIVVEMWFLGKYASEAASWHWFVHFFAGATLALIVMSWWSWRNRRPVPVPLVWVLLAHLFAAAPDLVIPESVPHQPWQNMFVGHLAAHYLPGRGVSWLAIFAAALAGYLLVISDRRMASGSRRHS